MTHTTGTRPPPADRRATPDSVLDGPSTWTLDPARSSAALRSKSMWGLVTVRGAFSELAGNARSSPAARPGAGWRSARPR